MVKNILVNNLPKNSIIDILNLIENIISDALSKEQESLNPKQDIIKE